MSHVFMIGEVEGITVQLMTQCYQLVQHSKVWKISWNNNHNQLWRKSCSYILFKLMFDNHNLHNEFWNIIVHLEEHMEASNHTRKIKQKENSLFFFS